MNQLCSFACYICFGLVDVIVGCMSSVLPHYKPASDVFPTVGVPFAFLIYLLGWSAIASLVAVVVLTPIVRYCTRSVYRMSRKIPVERDKRVSVVREMLQSVTAVKLNAWDGPFMQKAASAREQELRWAAVMIGSSLAILTLLSRSYRAIKTSKLAGAVLTTFDRWIPMLAIWLAFMTHTVIRRQPFPASTALIAPKM